MVYLKEMHKLNFEFLKNRLEFVLLVLLWLTIKCVDDFAISYSAFLMLMDAAVAVDLFIVVVVASSKTISRRLSSKRT
jgi:hypothetical protein